MADLESNWQRFVQWSYLSKEKGDQKALFSQLQQQCKENCQSKIDPEAQLGKKGRLFSSSISNAFQSGADRLIFSSIPWRAISQTDWKELGRWSRADKNRQLIFLEWRVKDLAHALTDANWSEELGDCQVSLHYCSGLHGEIALQLLASEVAYHRCNLEILAHEDHWKGFFGALWTRAGQIKGIGDELLKAPNTAAFCLRNGPHQSKDANLLQLKGSLQDVPAILCGAGPSLAAEFKALATCRAHSLIIGCGSAALALQKAQIAPHAISTICPLRASFERWQRLDTFTTPALSCLRIFPGVDELLAGPRLHLSGLSSAPATLWIERALGFETADLHFGNSTLTATLLSCLLMGCNPIFLVGVDLSYGPTGDKYVAGVQKLKSISSGTDLLAPFKASGFEKEVLTNWPWWTESCYLREIIAGYPDQVVRRCGQQGLAISGIERGSLQNWAKKAHPRRDLENLLWSQLACDWARPQTWRAHYDLMRASLMRCIDHFRQKKASLSAISPWKRFADPNFVRSYLESLEFRRGQEIAFDVFFQPIQRALEPLEFDDMQRDLKRAKIAPAESVNALLLQQATDRLGLLVKKGDYFLQLIEQQLAC